MRCINVLAAGDSIVEAECDSRRGWCGRAAERLAREIGAQLKFHNRGFGGESTVALLHRLGAELRREPRWDVVFVGVGINDSRKIGPLPLRYEVEPASFKANLRQICNTLLEGANIERIFFAGLIPVIEEKTSPIKENTFYFSSSCSTYEKLLEDEIARHSRIDLIDFWNPWFTLEPAQRSRMMPDGLHPNSEGYKFLAETAWQSIRDKFMYAVRA